MRYATTSPSPSAEGAQLNSAKSVDTRSMRRFCGWVGMPSPAGVSTSASNAKPNGSALDRMDTTSACGSPWPLPGKGSDGSVTGGTGVPVTGGTGVSVTGGTGVSVTGGVGSVVPPVPSWRGSAPVPGRTSSGPAPVVVSSIPPLTPSFVPSSATIGRSTSLSSLEHAAREVASSVLRANVCQFFMNRAFPSVDCGDGSTGIPRSRAVGSPLDDVLASLAASCDSRHAGARREGAEGGA